MAGHNTTQNRKIASRAIISALVLMVVFCGMAAAEQLYVNESGWWRVDGAFNASGTPIQGAVGAAVAGDSIYVEGGNYYENVDVRTAHLTLEGEGADVVTVTAADPGDHVFEMTGNWVNISGFAVRGATDSDMSGIYLGNVHYCNISGNNIYGNCHGIYLCFSNNNMLASNTASNNWYGNGIYLSSSSSNTLSSNTANSNGHDNGICISSSSSNTLENNNCSNNWHGIHLSHSNDNTLKNNNCSNNDQDAIHLWDSSSNTLTNNIALSSWCGIHLTSSSNHNTLGHNDCSNNLHGIYLYFSSNNTLENNNCSNNKCGSYLHNADDNIITCNWVHNNTQKGLTIYDGSTGNDISYNNIITNGDHNATSSGWEWNFYNYQYQPVEAKHNYWGAGMNSSTIDASIYDDEEGGGRVEFYPFETEPVPCTPGPKRPAFTTTDAAIALQIAVGSRPYDATLDVSGDGCITSLDALMILQVVGDIKIG